MSSRIEQIIQEIEEYVDSCKFQPLSTTKIVVNKEEIEELLRELRLKTPDEIKRYQKIINNKDAILEDAQTKADALIADGVDAVFTPTDNTIMTAELSIYEKFIDAGIPHYTGADSFALNGAFVGYGVDYANLGQKTADMIADILVDNADPAKTAVETFDNGTATVNTETCKALGLDFDTVKKAFEPLCTQVNEITTAESFDEVESK